MSDDLEIDFERFIYEKIETFGGDSYYLRVGCNHINVEDVRNLHTGTVVARLCIDCDTQLPVEGRSDW